MNAGLEGSFQGSDQHFFVEEWLLQKRVQRRKNGGMCSPVEISHQLDNRTAWKLEIKFSEKNE